MGSNAQAHRWTLTDKNRHLGVHNSACLGLTFYARSFFENDDMLMMTQARIRLLPTWYKIVIQFGHTLYTVLKVIREYRVD